MTDINIEIIYRMFFFFHTRMSASVEFIVGEIEGEREKEREKFFPPAQTEVGWPGKPVGLEASQLVGRCRRG